MRGLILFATLTMTNCEALSQQLAITSASDESIRTFVRGYVKADSSDKEMVYSRALVDLNDDGTNEAIVYLGGHEWCGSGGCTMLLLRPEGSIYRLITRVTITQTPVRVLNSRSHGWHDIAVSVRGGGIQPGYEALLRFNGRTYPTNPSVPPAQRVTQRPPGKVVIPASPVWIPLHP